MELRAFLEQIAGHYDRHARVSAPEQLLLRHADQHLADHVPAGIVIAGRGGQTLATFTPFIAFLDPDEQRHPLRESTSSTSSRRIFNTWFSP